jgi:hypothetical protein
MELAERSLAGGCSHPAPERHRLVVHAEAEALVGGTCSRAERGSSAQRQAIQAPQE